MKKYLILCFLLFIAIGTAIGVTITKGLIGKQDLSLWNGTSTKTFTRTNEDSYTLTLNQFDWVGVDVLQKFGGGVSRTKTTIDSALTTVGASNDVALWFSPGTWTITDDLTITSNVTMEVPAGATFSITAGKTLTIQGPIRAGAYQIFSGSGTVSYSGPGVYNNEWESGGSGTKIPDTLECANGTTINEFSTDGTLAGNSDDAVPTEKAVKTYVDGVSYISTIWVSAAAMTPLTTNGAGMGTNEYATNDIMLPYAAFDGTTEEYVAFSFPMPEEWNLGTIKAKFFWSSATSSSTNDTVEWELQAGAISNDDAIDAALGTAQVISDVLLADNGTDMQVTSATPAITVGGTPALGDMIHFKLSRNVGGTDNMTEDAWLYGVLIQLTLSTSASAW